ncbi:FAD-dependent oxidoreductase [Tepidibacter hydrothermalis]|uniref:FAD-dependent oxidoreductase n=1 Tax=Tepidibacter hydrothermalis TaxID=3036126 RepID=A0ABY8E7K5_9FIRM|nr:FAD-dependent oxidoreductase [Tepidibacter hydrothermalis]WFD08888.1 FAD-dependent oxidoreductase [Tepidibacter hydrothermalis]
MNKNINIFGDVNNIGESNVCINKTIKEILNEYAGGMTGYKNVKLVQIGGPLGEVFKANNLNYKLSKYADSMVTDTIVFFNDLMCPVDFIRFCTRYVIRELGIRNDHVEKINILIENITSGLANEGDFEKLRETASEKADTYAENELHKIILYMADNFKNEFIDHIINKKCKTGICRKLFVAQCINGCPAEVNVPGYIALMADDRIKDAYSLMRKNNPLPFVCGMVCSRPCEDRCRRGEIEKTVGVRALKRYASDRALKTGEYKEDRLESKGKKVAIVGGGPAGLSAAYFLSKTGYEVIIYEANEVIGGMLALGIPEYRLPQAVIDKEVELVKNLGVEIITNTRVGKDVTLKELRNKFDSVLLSTGTHIGNKFGPDVKEIETAIDLLREVKVEGRKEIGENVLVIGGGDVAMDAARTSVRLGAKNVIVASLETFETMPASDEEKYEALEEGVEFVSGYGTKDIHEEGGKLKEITLKKCISIVDDKGIFSPIYDNEDLKKFEIDSLILAIGQRPDNSYLDEDIEINERGWIKINSFTFETSVEGVFAAGDIYRPGVAVKAIAEAKKAAQSIDRYLGGTGLYTEKEIEIPQGQLHYDLWFEEKINEKIINVAERVSNFKEITLTMSDIDAKCEAKRCLRCDRNTRSS